MGTSEGARKGWANGSREDRIAAQKAAWTPEKRQAFSERMKARAKDPAAREKLQKAAQARWNKPGSKERASKSRADQLADPQKKARHSKAMARPETRAKISKAVREQWASLPEEEKNRRMRELRRRFKGGHRLTSIEAAVMLELNARGLFYQVHAQVDNYTADLLIHTPRLIIECDGAWHHAQRQDTDAARDARLLELGYPTLRLSEAEIKAKDWSRLNEALA